MKLGPSLPGFGSSTPASPSEQLELLGWCFRRESGQVFTLDEQLGYWVMRMAVAARLAYQPPPPIKPGDFNEKAKSLVFFDRGTTQAYGYSSEGYRCLVFRGSQQPIDFAVDGAVWLVGYPARHFGFELGWKKVRSEIEDWLKDGAEPKRPLLLAGHSLGGALAILAAYHLSEHYPIAGVITFGGPRVGAACFAEEYAKRTSPTGRPLGKVT
ncbi:MAG TPA: lipase family protein, partial [Candidatus Cybelea sp.]|nr:lipase family protein [Candidatus Cybelea sp.]